MASELQMTLGLSLSDWSDIFGIVSGITLALFAIMAFVIQRARLLRDLLPTVDAIIELVPSDNSRDRDRATLKLRWIVKNQSDQIVTVWRPRVTSLWFDPWSDNSAEWIVFHAAERWILLPKQSTPVDTTVAVYFESPYDFEAAASDLHVDSSLKWSTAPSLLILLMTFFRSPRISVTKDFEHTVQPIRADNAAELRVEYVYSGERSIRREDPSFRPEMSRQGFVRRWAHRFKRRFIAG